MSVKLSDDDDPLVQIVLRNDPVLYEQMMSGNAQANQQAYEELCRLYPSHFREPQRPAKPTRARPGTYFKSIVLEGRAGYLEGKRNNVPKHGLWHPQDAERTVNG